MSGRELDIIKIGSGALRGKMLLVMIHATIIENKKEDDYSYFLSLQGALAQWDLILISFLPLQGKANLYST